MDVATSLVARIYELVGFLTVRKPTQIQIPLHDPLARQQSNSLAF